ncbi:MAG: RsbRD N-terminal domain-containing protein [Proteobacteria bacterium]|nr:RsbRD N-terminal domain-containing protein [Pseudomonadota bacterium]
MNAHEECGEPPEREARRSGQQRASLEQAIAIEALRVALAADRSALVERWLEAAAARSWHLRTAPACRVELRAHCAAVLDALAEGLAQASSLATGAAALREPLQRLSFVAGWIAGQPWPIGAVVALAQALREVLSLPSALADDLVLVVTEAYSCGLRDQALARRRELLMKSQVVCLLRPSLVALWLVGDPDHAALDDALGRWLMLAVIHDAGHLLLELSAACDPATVLEGALRRLAEQPEPLVGRQLWVVAPEARRWLAGCAAAQGLPITVAESVAEALTGAESGGDARS